MFGSVKPKTVVRKITTVISKPAPSNDGTKTKSSTPSTRQPITKSTQARSCATTLTNHKTRPATNSPAPAARKRKASTPPPQWSDDDDDKVEDNFALFSSPSSNNRARSIALDESRRLLDDSEYKDDGSFDLAHAADLVSGDTADKHMPFFREEMATEVLLQYPSNSKPERFFLAKTTEYAGFNSVEDIRETVKYICAGYLPPSATDETTGFERRLSRAANKGNKDEFINTLSEFNAVVTQALADGTIRSTLLSKHSLDFDWTRRILDQVYARTVSPHVDILREYKNGTDNVYGELLYPFVSDILLATRLRSDQIFVDLGSGVGNVVLQAALETGCEAWGCEMMPNPCELARLQADEFRARARLWGLHVGAIHLLEGDFLENPVVADVLRRADVVLINNQAFGPDLNSKLVDRFLDLKDGCQIVSLKSFKPEGFEIQDRNVNDVRHLLDVRKLEYYSNRVSWTDAPGNYFIARKDPSALVRFQKGLQRGVSSVATKRTRRGGDA